ncbi:MAG: discoidin domain-containing protein [Flavobacterium sp.]
MKKLINALVILLSSFGFSQNYKGDIANVTESGFHQMTIEPTIRAYAKDDLRHFRILDNKQNQIPYAFVAGKKQSQSCNQLNIVSKESIPDSITSLIVESESAKKISQFNLQIENTSLVKSYTVSGSNDGNKWFGLVANKTLQNMVSSSGTSVKKTINFPANTYKFLRIVLNDKKSLPINILSAGTSEMQTVP